MEKIARTKRGTVKSKRLYNTWLAMKRRCYKQDHKSYMYYGGKGISVCDEWRNSYESFQEWAFSHGYKDNLSIDRIDSSKDYTADNCRWITMSQQQQNKSNCIFVTHDGITMNIAEWCRKLNVTYHKAIIKYRLLKSKGEDITFDSIFDENDNPNVTHKRQVKRINQFTKDGLFIKQWESMNEIVKCGYKQSDISRCCNGARGRKTAYGFVWKYDD